MTAHVVLLTHYFPPEVGAPQTRISALAEGLSERGFSVAVHTCPPHYPDGVIQAPYGNRIWSEERLGGVRVVRSAVAPAANRGFLRRLVDHASFACSAVSLAHRLRPADVVVVESPPLFLAAAGVIYARRLRAPPVLNVADLWPDSAVELGALTNRPAIRAARVLERLAYRNAAAITAPTEGIVETLEARPESGGKVTRMLPFVDTARFDVGRVSRQGGPLRVLYAGTTGMAQGLDVLLEAARIAGPETVQVRVAGGGAEQAALRARAAGIPNVEMLGVRPSAEIPGLYGDADAAVVLLRDVPLFRGALPTKMFEAMAAGRPLVLAAAGEPARLVAGAGSGVVVRPDDPRQLAGAFLRLATSDPPALREMGEAGRRTAAEHDVGQAVDRWVELLRRVRAGAAA
jgi:glycosyltransferase involved in cell wall biosynthesis